MRTARLFALLLLAATLVLGGCLLNPPQKTANKVNVAVVMYPGGGAPPATLALYKAALEVSKAGTGEYDLNLVTIAPQIDQFQKPQSPTDGPPTVTALEQALAQDPPPDVVLFNSTYEFSSAVGKEMLVDLDQYLRGDRLMPKEDYYPGALEAVSEGGRVFGLPIAGGPTVLQYDKRLFDAAGLSAPSPNWTWSEFLDVARRLTKVTGDPETDQYALNVMMGPNVLPAFIWQNGGELLSKDGRRALLGEPAALEGLKFYFDLTNSYKVAAPMPQPGIKRETFARAPAIARPIGPNEVPPLFGPSGRVAMTYVPNAGGWMGMMPFGQGEERPLRFAELPRGKVAATLLDLQTVVAVTAKAKNPRLAYKVAAALTAEMQKELPVPTRRSAAKNLRRMSPALAEEDAQVVLNAMEYARPMPMNGNEKFMRPFYEKLLNPLQSGTKTPAEAAKEAVEAIDQALNE